MIDELLGRINAFYERIWEIRKRRKLENIVEDDDYDESDPDKDSPENEEEEWLDPRTQIPDEIFFDETTEDINGQISYYWHCTKPLRYTVSPDNPWYFDIDGVVFSKETGLLVLFPPGKGEEYTIPDDDRITGIGYHAFSGNPSLKKIVFNEKIRYIGRYAFEDCEALEEITLPATVEYMDRGAFALCHILKKAVLEYTVKEIPHSIFRGCTALEAVRYPAEITFIDKNAFTGCTALKDVKPFGYEDTDCNIIIAPSISRIGKKAFSDCTAVQSVLLPESPLSIESGAFMGCSALQQINTQFIQSYGNFCFRNCLSLENFTFSTNTRYLGREVFAGTENLRTICFSCTPDFTCERDSLLENRIYIVDTAAYLAVQQPYKCKPVFLTCILNLARGEKVPEDLEENAVKIMKRNRRKHFDWFLSDVKLLDWILARKIPDCDDAMELQSMAKKDNPQAVAKIETYIQQHFNRKKIAEAREKQIRHEDAQRERELEEKRIQEKKKKCEEIILKGIPEGIDISLEDMNLSTRAYYCLKRYGINTLKELAAMSEEDLMRVRNLGRSSMKEVQLKLTYYLSGGQISLEKDRPSSTRSSAAEVKPKEDSVDDLTI